MNTLSPKVNLNHYQPVAHTYRKVYRFSAVLKRKVIWGLLKEFQMQNCSISLLCLFNTAVTIGGTADYRHLHDFDDVFRVGRGHRPNYKYFLRDGLDSWVISFWRFRQKLLITYFLVFRFVPYWFLIPTLTLIL